MSVVAKAWEVGDFYANDPTGVPAVVAYVDESGEHGLIMAPCCMNQASLNSFKKNLNFHSLEKTYQDIILDLDSPNKMKQSAAKANAKLFKLNVDSLKKVIAEKGDLLGEPYHKTITWLDRQDLPKDANNKGFKMKLFNEYTTDLASENTEYGENNTKKIAEYCSRNGIDMSLYFPTIKYAIGLGEGWFAPGNYELELIATYYVEAVGSNYKKDMREFKSDTILINKLGGLHTYQLYPNITNLQSSTMTKSSWGDDNNNKGKTGRFLSNEGVVQLIGSAVEEAIYYSLVKAIQSGNAWMVFAVNNYNATPVVVKRF